MGIPFRPLASIGEAVVAAADEVLVAGKQLSSEFLSMPVWQRTAVKGGGELPETVMQGISESLSFEGYAAVPPLKRIMLPKGMPVMQIDDGLNEPAILLNPLGLGRISFPGSIAAAERADTIAAGGYAQMIHSDPVARISASRIVRDSIGFIPHKFEGYASPEQMAEIATDGAIKYTKGLPGNSYTDFLRQRFGDYDLVRDWVKSILG